MAEINLLKAESRSLGADGLGRAQKLWLSILGIFLVLELLTYGYLIFAQNKLQQKNLDLDQRAAGLDFEIGKIDKERTQAISYQGRLGSLQELLDNHLFWSQVLTEIERYTYKPATMTSLQVGQKEHSISLSGTVPSYTDLAKVILGFRSSPNVLDIKLRSSGQVEGKVAGYSFGLDIIFDPKLLLK